MTPSKENTIGDLKRGTEALSLPRTEPPVLGS